MRWIGWYLTPRAFREKLQQLPSDYLSSASTRTRGVDGSGVSGASKKEQCGQRQIGDAQPFAYHSMELRLHWSELRFQVTIPWSSSCLRARKTHVRTSINVSTIHDVQQAWVRCDGEEFKPEDFRPSWHVFRQVSLLKRDRERRTVIACW